MEDTSARCHFKSWKCLQNTEKAHGSHGRRFCQPHVFQKCQENGKRTGLPTPAHALEPATTFQKNYSCREFASAHGTPPSLQVCHKTKLPRSVTIMVVMRDEGCAICTRQDQRTDGERGRWDSVFRAPSDSFTPNSAVPLLWRVSSFKRNGGPRCSGDMLLFL